MFKPIAIAATILGVTTISAQALTDAAAIKPILTATKANWVAVREFDGQDLVYFTHLEAWRCGLEALSYSINGGDDTVRELETCYEGEAAPNAMKEEGRLPFITQPLGSVETITIRLLYDDGTTDEATFARDAVKTP